MNKKFLKQHFSPRSFNRFLIVGVVNTAFSLGFFPLFYWLMKDFLSLNVIVSLVYVLTTLFSFLTHKFFTFGMKGGHHRQGIKYYMLCGVNYVINMAILNTMLPYFPDHPVILQIIIVVLLQLVNYLAMNRFIFTHTKADTP